jgi:hypothetical protein
MRYFLGVAAAITASVASPAMASTLYSNPLLTGAIVSPGSVGFSANSGSAQSGALSFKLNGFASLDGVNFFEDDFTLMLNGAPILTLSYDLGGGGSNAVFSNLYGATISGGANAYFQGGTLLINIASLPLIAGSNSFSFSYDSPTGGSLSDPLNGHAGPQGLGDEGWGVSDVLLTGSVPEPASWALMIAGFGLTGAAMRRRNRVHVTYA